MRLKAHLDVVFGVTIAVHQVEVTVVNINELVFNTLDIRDLHVVSRRRDIFQFFAIENLHHVPRISEHTRCEEVTK